MTAPYLSIIKTSISSSMLHYLEGCAGCAACATSCPFFYSDEKYAPVNKAEKLRQIYRKYFTFAGRVLGPLVGAREPRDWNELIEFAYRCTDCGFCYITCSFGIDTGLLLRTLRGIIDVAGKTPALLKRLVEYELSGEYLKSSAWQDFLSEVQKLSVPLDAKSRVLAVFSLYDILVTRNAALALLKILKKVGENFSLYSKPLGFRAPVAHIVGRSDLARKMAERIVKELEATRPEYVVLIDGGYPYSFWRYEVTNLLGRKLNIKIVHGVELIAEYVASGKLKLEKKDEEVTWHDSCHLGRRGGVFKEPRVILSQGARLKEMPQSKNMAWCLGGDFGVWWLAQGSKALKEMLGVSSAEDGLSRGLSRDLDVWLKRYSDYLKKGRVKKVIVGCPICLESLRYMKNNFYTDLEVENIFEYILKVLVPK